MPQQLPVPDAYRREVRERAVRPLRTVYHGSREKVVRWRGALQTFQSREEPVEATGRRYVCRESGHPVFCTISKHSICSVWVVLLFFLFFLKESQTVSGNVNLIAYMIRLIKM